MSKFARYERARPKMSDSSKPEALVRRAEIRDCKALAEIKTEREGSGDIGAQRDWFESLLSRPSELVLVGEVSREVVAYGRVVHHQGSVGCPAGWYLVGLVVSPPHRRRGIGRFLTEERLEWIAGRAPEAFYFANERNAPTIDLHGTLGFVEMTRDFTFPGVQFEGGGGILFHVDLRTGPGGGA